MRTRIIVIAGVAAVLVLGTGAVLVDAASNNTPPQRQTTTNEITLNPSEEMTQNPLVNPSAAGTQSGFQGYGASSPATREQPGSTPEHGSVTPGAGRFAGSGSSSPAAAPVENERQAHARLTKLGYSRIERLNQNKDGWIALARRGQRQVTVQLDNDGNVVAER
jgi:hypothetical protein